MYNVSNGTLKVGQAVQYKACVLSLKTAEIFRIHGKGSGKEQAGGVEPTHSHTEISRATYVRFFNVFISLDLPFHKLSNAIFEIVLLQKLAKI